MKKKLDEMTEEEVKQLEKRYCTPSIWCVDCPLNIEGHMVCLTQFPFWKEMYEKYKDKEFDVEVDEND